ncbi:RNA-binding protein 28 [Acanthopagrus latus]|uniref:RNA-binding protein 28 n=1 Tax=Acanthopagrus latus TaxID=8177 RepID=UPI00187CE88C|nr:RNA-binding protein 28 [Acanthopagrus latus]
MSANTLFVQCLPATATNKQLEEVFSEIGPVKQCFVVREKGTETCRGFGYVTFSMVEDAQRALKEVKEYDGKRLSLSVAKGKLKDNKKPAPKQKGLKKNLLKAKLIIRNLSFQCSEDDLKQVCAKFGEVLEVKIPLKPDGKMRGFAFVLFKTVYQAGTALKELNLKEIKGRQVAVDWAVPKDRYLATQQPSSAGNKNTAEATAKHSDTESDEEEEEEEKPQAAPEKKKVISKPAVQQVEESQSDDEEESEEQDSEEEEEEEEEDGDDDDDDDDISQEEEDDKSSLGSNDDQDESVDEDEDEDEDDDEEDKAEKAAQKKARRRLLPSDVKDGRTLFIRNLSFDTEEEGLEEVLLRYGELNYVKIVVNPDTEHSKGCAFAQFKTKEAAEKCMAAAENDSESGGIRVDGRKLFVVAAVTREDAAKLKVDKTKVESGTRNLYLAREGLVRAGTKAAEGVPEADMIKRTRFEELKRAKLRDMNVYVSKTRLCIHNLPKSVDNKKLRALCLEAVKDQKGVRITECRVMYDKKPVKGQVTGTSLGYGFVQFQDHDHALGTLRHLNNNPTIFGPHKRPIVEFSLEDLKKLKMKEERQQKNKELARNQYKGGAIPRSQTARDGKGPWKGGNEAPSSSLQAGKERVPPQQQKKDKRYSGFMTNPEVEHIDLEHGKKRRKVLAFPSHRGPKIRMRDKGKQKAPPPKQAKPGFNRKERQRRQMEKPTQTRNQNVKMAKKPSKNRDRDRFDNLVEQYKKKLTSNCNTNMKRNKWFDS